MSALIENRNTVPDRPTIKAIEESVLGAVLSEPRLLAAVKGEVGAEHFSTAVGQRIFDAVAKLVEAGDRVTRAAVADDLGIYEWDEPGGIDTYLAGLLARRSREDDVVSRARDVRSAADARAREMSLYDEDIVAWSHEQRRLLGELATRPGLPPIDWVNVVEEIVSVGRFEISGVARRIELVFMHLIKTASTPEAASVGHWRLEIDLHLERFRAGYKPSMRRLLNTDRLWASARHEAARQLGDYGERVSRALPKDFPLTLDDLLKSAGADALMAKLGG